MTDLEMLVKLSKRVLLPKCPWILDINDILITDWTVTIENHIYESN